MATYALMQTSHLGIQGAYWREHAAYSELLVGVSGDDVEKAFQRTSLSRNFLNVAALNQDENQQIDVSTTDEERPSLPEQRFGGTPGDGATYRRPRLRATPIGRAGGSPGPCHTSSGACGGVNQTGPKWSGRAPTGAWVVAAAPVAAAPVPALPALAWAREWPVTEEGGGVGQGSPPVQEAMRGHFRTQFRKTQWCRFLRKGCLMGDDCNFAHSLEELEPPPDLTKTSLCKLWEQGVCPWSPAECHFAHGPHDLRVTPQYLKRSLCKQHLRGTCILGSHCRHAHGPAELQRGPEEAAAILETNPAAGQQWRQQEKQQGKIDQNHEQGALSYWEQQIMISQTLGVPAALRVLSV